MKNGDLPARPRLPTGSYLDADERVVGGQPGATGFTKREEFAKAALQGLCANPWILENTENILRKADTMSINAILAGLALERADALLAAMEKQK